MAVDTIFALVKIEIMRGARRIKTVVGLLDIITLALFLHWPGQSQQTSARWTPVLSRAWAGRVGRVSNQQGKMKFLLVQFSARVVCRFRYQ